MRFWEYFEYDVKSDSSKCVTFDIKTKDACGQVLKYYITINQLYLSNYIICMHFNCSMLMFLILYR